MPLWGPPINHNRPFLAFLTLFQHKGSWQMLHIWVLIKFERFHMLLKFTKGSYYVSELLIDTYTFFLRKKTWDILACMSQVCRISNFFMALSALHCKCLQGFTGWLRSFSAISTGKPCNIFRDFPAICKYYRVFPADIAEKPLNHHVNIGTVYIFNL